MATKKPDPKKDAAKKRESQKGFAAMAALANRPKGKKKG